jgi:hypothetical protein
VLDNLSPYTLIVSTPGREIKMRAENDERHSIWLRALSYLQSRPITMGQEETEFRAEREEMSSLKGSTGTWLTPEASTSAPAKQIKAKRSLTNLFQKRPVEEVPPVPTISSSHHDEGDDELENVRSCCGGKHDLNQLCNH